MAAEKEEQIIAIIKDKDLQTKLSLIAINNLILKKKELAKIEDQDVDLIDLRQFKMTRELIAQSNDIISGQRCPNPEEILDIDQYFTPEELLNKADHIQNKDSIVNYWFKALQNSGLISQEITKKDEPILLSLKKLDINSPDDGTDFQIIFHFDQNDYFTNDVLQIFIKTNDDDEPIKTEATEILWKEGKNITRKTVKKKNKKKEVEQSSFFNLFKSIDINSESFLKMPKEQQEKIKERLETIFDIGNYIYSDIAPYSLEYYLGVQKEQEDESDDDDVEEYDDDEDDQDELLTKEDAIKKMKGKRQPKKK